MVKQFLVISACSGLIAVCLGAFGAHGLRGKIDLNLMNAFQTGVQYQFYHTLALMLVALLAIYLPHSKALLFAGWAFVLGMLLFSGSLYGLALSGPRWLGPITPLGGLSFIVGWVCLFVAALRFGGTQG